MVLIALVGTEGCGKTSLALQLQALAKHRELPGIPQPVKLLTPSELIVAPTTGQELFHFSICPQPEPLDAAVCVPAQPDSASTRHAEVEITLRELGGRLAPSWGRFLSRDDIDGIIYVVDSTQPWQLPIAAVEFLQIATDLQRRDELRPLLLLLNKSAHLGQPPRLTLDDVHHYFVAPLPRGDTTSTRLSITVAVVDSWIGLGLDDVISWLLRRTAPNIRSEFPST